MKTHSGSILPDKVSVNAGYFSEANRQLLASEPTDAYIATEKTNQQATM